MTEDSKIEASKGKAPRRRITMDAQLLSYWEREALRLDALAADARWGWMSRSYARKAERARAQANRSAAREAARTPETQNSEGQEPAARELGTRGSGAPDSRTET